MVQREKLAKQIEYMEMMLDRATRLISGLAGEKIRWEETVKVCKNNSETKKAI
jgi:dynein heavy chain, axonemal